MNKKIFLATVTLLFINYEIYPLPKNSKIFVAGHRGLVGSAILRKLEQEGYSNIVVRNSKELDLRDKEQLNKFFEQEQPEYVFLAAAKVGGIKANMDYPADFIFDNLAIETNVIQASHKYNVKKLLFLGSSCIYPRLCPQPIKEEYLLTSELEKTNEPYAIAKIAGLKMCQAFNKQYGTKFISCMPTNLYGPNDNFDLQTSHVLPALIAKFVKAKKENQPEVVIWGTGKARREFLYVDDLAEACIFLMDKYENDLPLNIGTGEDITILEVAQAIKEIVGFEGKIVFDTTKPDGTPQKLLTIEKIRSLGWEPSTSLRDGLQKTIEWYMANYNF